MPATALPVQVYGVWVNGDSPYLLQLVQRVEPTASVQDYNGRRGIQAGVFTTEGNAIQRVSVLQQQGISAKIVSTAASGGLNQAGGASSSANPGTGLMHVNQVSPQTMTPVSLSTGSMAQGSMAQGAIMTSSTPAQLPPHFEVVVPSAPESFAMVTAKMLRMGVRPEAIQAKQSRRGPYISVGPFSQVEEANSVNSYLRSGGLDARVFYQK
jgi:cell division protein FtsN